MSTYWDIYCRDCNHGVGFSINHGEERLRALLRSQETWAQLSVCDLSDVELRLSGDEKGGMTYWPQFADDHLTHDVALRNEYGSFDDQCGVPVRCPGCGAQHSCSLPRHHSGEHKS